MLARQFSMSYGQRPMLLLRTKTVLVDGKPVKVYYVLTVNFQVQ